MKVLSREKWVWSLDDRIRMVDMNMLCFVCIVTEEREAGGPWVKLGQCACDHHNSKANTAKVMSTCGTTGS